MNKAPSTPVIAIIGSVNADDTFHVQKHPKPGETVLSQSFTQSGGGKGANAAAAAGRAGLSPWIIGAVGKDITGQILLQQLNDSGVRTDLVLERTQPSGRALISVDAHGENAIIVSPGANATLSGSDVTEQLHKLLDNDQWQLSALCVSAEISLEAVEAAIKFAVDHALWCVLNPAPVSVGLPSILARFTSYPRLVITPNALEMKALVDLASGHERVSRNEEHDYTSLALALSARFQVTVCATLGSDGVVLIDRGARSGSVEPSVVTLAARKVSVVDTVGAGDAFNGAFTAGLAHNLSLVSAAEKGIIAASETVQHAGARPD